MNAAELEPAVRVQAVSHRYGDRLALDAIDFAVRQGDVFGLLGPNGSGKTTLFGIITTLLRPSSGEVRVLGHDALTEPAAIRARLGVAFQTPALDDKLTIRENLRCAGALYGVASSTLEPRADALLDAFGLTERAGDLVGDLSGGLARRADLARALIHQPDLLIMDEPTTGLDPGARQRLWQMLNAQRAQGLTVAVATHLMSDAEECDQLGVLCEGRLVTLDTPDGIRAQVGGDVLLIQPKGDLDAVRDKVAKQLGVPATRLGALVRVEHPDAHRVIPTLVESMAGELAAVTLSQPTLEDAYAHVTGQSFDGESGS